MYLINELLFLRSFTDDLQGGIRCKALSRKFADWLTSPELGASLQQFVDEGKFKFTKRILIVLPNMIDHDIIFGFYRWCTRGRP